ncbi:hypothetical protein [Pedobacter alluvionis]|uniref:Uncharacterized protein n=1 Tax=Pedobacter alluvionis TaxID=475253 RepID=A0A497YBJ5_9SPHI|nr:hypothetical protein [Pedobacter alluvionis]RLJ80575.1 hypothetical protein BCL90_1359 [Pedobacter alluvionis]TFB31841.1 hypothetical protein E3V97_14785 [Pedobacter alluvionis]
MKKIYSIFTLLLLISFSVFGQTYPLTMELIVNGKSFPISCEPKDGYIQVTIKDDKDTELKKYVNYSQDIDAFATRFVQTFDTVCNLPDSVKKLEKDNWKTFANKLFNKFQLILQNKLPEAGLFSVKPYAKLYINYFNPDSNKFSLAKTDLRYKLVKIDAEISEGYLESIVAYVKFEKDEEPHKYILEYPVGMSSEDNIRNFNKYNLYEEKSSPYAQKKTKVFLLNLSDVISYNYRKEPGRRDYSPKDTSLNEMPGGTSIMLHKEETSKLFEAHFYSDFKGFNEEKPNGIIQVELAKRINTNTYQHRAPRFLYYWAYKSGGFFQYISPVATLSKIEQHNRKLNLHDLDSVRFNTGGTNINQFGNQYHRYANALSLYQYQWLSVGTDLNLAFVNNPGRKFHIYFNLGARFGFTDTIDSLTTINGTTITKTKFTKDISVSTLQVYPEIKIKFFPQEQFNFSIANKWIYFKPLNQVVQMVGFDRDNASILKPKNHAWLNTSEMLMTIQVNPKSKVFGRFRMNWEIGNIKNNFSQLQVGYSTYILGR